MATRRLPIGKRLLPSVLDEWVALEPHKTAAILPTSGRMDTWNRLTYLEYSELVNSLAWYIEKTVGRSENAETISYIGANDWRYPSFWVAAMKCGYCVLSPSVRNANEEHVALMRDTGCKKLFYTNELERKAQSMKPMVEGKFEIIPIPSYADLLKRPEAKQSFSFDKTYEEWANRRALCFHTSGTTGLPQPRFLTHAYFATMDNVKDLKPPSGRRQALWSVFKDDLFFHNYPSFHAGGCFLNLVLTLFTGAIPVLQSYETPLSAGTFVQAAKSHKLVAAFVVPSFLEEASESTEALDYLGKLDYLFFGAGPLTERIGDSLAERTNLIQNFGSTEVSMLPHLIQKDWKCVEWNPNFGVVMDEVEPGLYELTIKKDPTKSHLQATFELFPDITEWRTKDLFTRGECVPNSWRFYGRRDQVIALSNGEKVSPVLMERHICEHPLISTCMVVGQGRMQTAALIEPDYKRWDAQRSPEEFISEVWPSIQEANKTTTATGQIFRNRIIVTRPEKSFVLVDKGTVSRARTLETFKDELDAIYSIEDDTIVTPLPADINPTSMKQYIRQCLSAYVDTDILQDETDFFAANMDSLQTIGFVSIIRTSLKAAYGNDPAGLTPAFYRRMVYENSTIGKMASRLTVLINNLRNPGATVDGLNGDAEAERQAKITAMVERNIGDLEHKIPFSPVENDLTVILTGSTGALGTYLLHNLCSNLRVAKVYCFDRRSGAEEVAQKNFESNGLAVGSLKKAEFLHVNFGDKNFGLTDAKTSEIVEKINTIIHSAWAVNFNHVLESFENPHIKGVRTLIDWSLQSPTKAHLFFVSSIGTVAEYTDPEPVPEILFEHCKTAGHLGYSESKHVAERILELVSKKTGLSTTILRLGQVAGPTTEKGKWNQREWFPILIKSSVALGKVPDSLGGSFGDQVDWVPVDVAADVCVELAFNARDNQRVRNLNVYHLVNPNPSSWRDLVTVVRDHYAARNVPMEIVSYKEWVDALREAAAEGIDEPPFEKVPAMKLFEFFEGMLYAPKAPLLATTEACKMSKTLSQLEAIQPATLARFLEQLNY